MLELLNTGRIFKAQELADILETNVRNIIEYKKVNIKILQLSLFFV